MTATDKASIWSSTRSYLLFAALVVALEVVWVRIRARRTTTLETRSPGASR